MADVALDDYIKTKHITRSSGRGRGATGRGRGRGARGARRGTQRQQGGGGLRSTRGISKSTSRRAPINRSSGGGQDRWQHDLFGSGALGVSGLRSRNGNGSSGTKLLISNLEFGVSDRDINDLFVEFGQLKKAAVHYDRSGRSIGTAEVIFIRAGDAIAALKKYNGVPLDGRAMDIQLVTSGVGGGGGGGGGVGGSRQNRLGTQRSGRGAVRTSNPSPGGGGRARGGRGASRSTRGRRGGAPGGGQRGGAKPEVTQEQLDMELDEYTSSTTVSVLPVANPGD